MKKVQKVLWIHLQFLNTLDTKVHSKRLVWFWFGHSLPKPTYLNLCQNQPGWPDTYRPVGCGLVQTLSTNLSVSTQDYDPLCAREPTELLIRNFRKWFRNKPQSLNFMKKNHGCVVVLWHYVLIVNTFFVNANPLISVRRQTSTTQKN